MAVAGGEVIEKFDDAIVRQAEATGAQVAAAKAAIGKVIFGQERVVEQAMMTVLSGGHALLVGLPGLAKTKLVEDHGHRARARRPPHPVHARPHAVRHRRQRSAGGRRRRASAISVSSAARSSASS